MKRRSTSTASAWRRRFASIMAVGAMVALGCSVDRGADNSGLPRVHITANGAMPAVEPLPVRYQSLDEPLLDSLADREHLRDLVAGTPRQFDQIVRLQDWVNAQWADGNPTPYPPWNALTVLDWIRTGKTGGFCAQYAQVFLQSLAALGYTARYIEIGIPSNPYIHYLTEVWSNDYDKWVLMDPDFNGHFERDGVPLSALEIHDALLANELTAIVPVFKRARAGHVTTASWPQHTAELYYYLRYHLNASHLTHPNDAPFERFDDMIEFVDPRVPVWESSTVPSAFPKAPLTRRRTDDRSVVEAKLNQVELRVQSASDRSVTFALRDNVWNRAYYEYRVVARGGQPDDWQTARRSSVTVGVPAAGGVVEVRGVNVRGVSGPTARLTIDPAADE